MRPNDNKLKTLGTQSAKLIAALYDLNREIFGIKEVCELTGLPVSSDVNPHIFAGMRGC
jgi:hypothetical protein